MALLETSAVRTTQAAGALEPDAPQPTAAPPGRAPAAALTPTLAPRKVAAQLPGFDRSPPQNGVRARSPAVAADTNLTVPPGGESLDPGDLERLIPRTLSREPRQLPDALNVTADVLRARLPAMAVDPSRLSIVREGDHDYLMVADRKMRLADSPTPPDASTPISRIARLGPAAPADKPMTGIRVSIDPGHCGDMEDVRSGNYVTASPGEKTPSSVPADALVEGDMALQTAKNLADRLTALGATVTLTHTGTVSRQQGREQLTKLLEQNPDLIGDKKPESVIRNADLERRAERIASANPDILISLHFDSESLAVDSEARKEVKAYVPGKIDAVYKYDQLQAKMLNVMTSQSWDASVRLANNVVSNVARATGQTPQSASTLGDVDAEDVAQLGSGVFARNQRTQTSVLGDPVNVFIEGAMYSQPEVFTQLMADKGTRSGRPGGFIDTYAKAISDGVVTFVRAGGN